jgi:predicted kinase
VTSLIITRGLPGCGKTTYARAWVEADREHRARVNRDDIRRMLDHGEFIKGITEGRVLAARDALILGLLARGLDVICDDTNLPQRTARDLARLAKRGRAEFSVVDMTDVPWKECIERDAARADKKPVGGPVIVDMHTRYLNGKSYPLPLPEEPADDQEAAALYEPKPGAPRAILVDIDGTVALKGARSPFDETRVHEDRPNLPVVTVVRALAATHQIVFLSGRTDGCRQATYEWLLEYIRVPFQGLYMRPAGDMRKDAIVKRELFDRHIREVYDVTLVLDDRLQVIRMWRDLGLTVLDVAGGEF